MPKAFPLQTALDHRLRIEEQCQAQLALSELALNAAREELLLARRSYQSRLDALDTLKRTAPFDPLAVIAGNARLARAQEAIPAAEAGVTAAEAAVATARGATVVAGQERLVLERLAAEFATEQHRIVERAEAERLGELGLARWSAQSKGPGP